MWKKKITAVLGAAFFAGSLAFSPTASATMISVGMDDLPGATAEANAAAKKRSVENKADQAQKPAVKKNESSVGKTSANNDYEKKFEKVGKTSSGKSGNAEKEKEKKSRFKEILRDDSFTYYMDTKTVRYIPMPYRQDRIIDVWVKLLPKDASAITVDEPYRSSDKYYMEHYYIHPKEKQIQFLCELEVTGRPTNAIKERPYNSQNWENLVPGSIEDDIYHAVVKEVEAPAILSGFEHKSLKDMLDDYLNIAI